ncbi:hypothetical protein [Prauserella flavalba]|uniref:hypothetical protein n=1 Tax=Prauserella flavalba TaxID=1477506 RepID=UPI0036E6DAA1
MSAEAAAQLVIRAHQISAAEVALGWLMRADPDRARQALEGLPTAVMTEISVVASALSSLADAVAVGRPPEPAGGDR